MVSYRSPHVLVTHGEIVGSRCQIFWTCYIVSCSCYSRVLGFACIDSLCMSYYNRNDLVQYMWMHYKHAHYYELQEPKNKSILRCDKRQETDCCSHGSFIPCDTWSYLHRWHTHTVYTCIQIQYTHVYTYSIHMYTHALQPRGDCFCTLTQCNQEATQMTQLDGF